MQKLLSKAVMESRDRIFAVLILVPMKFLWSRIFQSGQEIKSTLKLHFRVGQMKGIEYLSEFEELKLKKRLD